MRVCGTVRKNGGEPVGSGLRRNEILALMRAEGKASVEALAERFDVTVQTIRRDLGELANEGKIDRVHGGATIRQGVTNIVYEERRKLNAEAKERIARMVSDHVPTNVSLFINIGTTTEAVAHELLDHENITVVTNDINVANILSANESCEIIVSGGTLRRSDGGLVGDLATQMIEQFKVDIAIIGASALDEEGDLLDFDLREVRVSKSIIRHARKVYLVTDASKFERTAPVRIASFAELDAIFIDKPLPHGLQARCREWGTDVFVAD
ncbi:DeoR/GlpR family DNA-binding transcription regulator [Oceaniradius stylonematis]|uniref:DeoR/GlpR family DNA-binding transcription regulator n=1 Tax=Oceaniradius stylonematis TaxID=2184161 RepID=UPI003204C1B5